MIFALLFEDNEACSDKRKEYMAEHLAFLLKNSSAIQAAGPLFDIDQDCSAGGLWIVHADNIQSVRNLIREDPFWPTGLRKNVQIFEWKQVFANGAKLIE